MYTPYLIGVRRYRGKNKTAFSDAREVSICSDRKLTMFSVARGLFRGYSTYKTGAIYSNATFKSHMMSTIPLFPQRNMPFSIIPQT